MQYCVDNQVLNTRCLLLTHHICIKGWNSYACMPTERMMGIKPVSQGDKS